jgi:hypothetical protein
MHRYFRIRSAVCATVVVEPLCHASCHWRTASSNCSQVRSLPGRFASVRSSRGGWRFHMRINAADHARVKALSQRLGVSVARLLQESAFSEAYDRGDRVVMVAAPDAANGLLANIAGNINHLAHHANMAQELIAHAELETALGDSDGVPRSTAHVRHSRRRGVAAA